MKKTLLYVGSVAILFLSAVTFIFIPAAAPSANKKMPAFGKYDGKPILLEQGTDFANAVSQYSEMYKNQGKQLDETAYFYIYSYAFNSTVTTMAYTGAVQKAGYTAGDKTINRALLPYYSDADGNYSRKIFNSVSEADRNSLRKDVAKNVIFRRYYEDVFGSSDTVGTNHLFGLKQSPAELSFLQGMGTKERSFNLVSFDTTGYPDTEVAAYAAKNADHFTRYALSVLTVKDEAKAKSLLKQIQKKEVTFTDAVSNYSEKYYSGSDGKVSGSYQYQLKSIISAEKDLTAVTSLAKDALSDVIKTSNGYSIFRGDGDSIKADFSNSETLDVVRKYITANESGIIEDYYSGIGKSFSAAAVADGFDKACTTFNLTKVTVPAFPLNYGNTTLYGKVPGDTVKELVDANTNENFLKTAFSLHTGEISTPVVLGKYVVVVQLTGENDVPADESKATSIKNDVGDIDQSSAQTALFASKKIVNNVSTVYFNDILSLNAKNGEKK
jgi:hypothetical protein